MVTQTKQEIFDKLMRHNLCELFNTTYTQIVSIIKEPTAGLRHATINEIRKIVSEFVDIGDYLDFDGYDADLFVLSPLYMTDLYLISGHDVDLENYKHLNKPNAFLMWKTISEEDESGGEPHRKLACVMVIGEKSPCVNSDPNSIVQVMQHEIIHYILAYLEFNGYLNLREISEDHTSEFIEFLCDVLPVYVKYQSAESSSKSQQGLRDYIVHHIKKYFKDNVVGMYTQFMNELVDVFMVEGK